MTTRHLCATPVLLLTFFLVISNTTLSTARKDPQEYWNTVMKGEAMPQVVKALLPQTAESHSDQHQFVKNFDAKANVIIYHTGQVDHPGEKSPVKEVDVSVFERAEATAN
ncbi:uncharacterized protein [Coffea arabica]|uniref:Organ-specific protein P4-like n=1 Tax=Coffea arabica TaxID=13443 RepID=A0A6P6VF34_COFAR|nr:uncharacterized protein LOC113722454 [Coffea arabica]XP_027112287.1 uncharacterized protein LOC113731304 [Coffea arabica]